MTATTKVAAVDEEVEVPAGKFKAIRVERSTDQKHFETVWYAAGTGVVKWVRGTGESEIVVVLKSFTQGK